MGKGDRRNSNKMLKRRSRTHYKDRMSRPRQLARKPVAELAAAKAAAAAAEEKSDEDASEES